MKSNLIIDNLTYDELILLQSIVDYVNDQDIGFFTQNPDFDILYEKVICA